MARPRSDDKRSAIIIAATRVISSHGLGASTAMIAKEAGVSNGSLFTYFETKAELYNRLYVELKEEIAEVALGGLAVESGIREQMLHVWSRWGHWAVSFPEKQRALVQLTASDDITPENHQAVDAAFAGISQLIEQSRANGPMRDTPLKFIAALMSGLAEATIGFMIDDPANAETHCIRGFEAFWRMLT
ncbi:TetR/AcrR family transcriptional regulator [Alicyclobacillus sp. ALC3]|uniref:TetR/AcrR family transcriptional regulator n=1 Tax=Alicyclobacillus sp. ALC3 TaxID=2796143 RepID=UPI002379C9DF|nr:TetR/AcrR family transcriptional regulator [Alicyclobacillus sp. ALC3]WDL95637.1 TetR/AcrR family transcriptional regulator [Alicyclobacillus sp. ALC3]